MCKNITMYLYEKYKNIVLPYNLNLLTFDNTMFYKVVLCIYTMCYFLENVSGLSNITYL